MMEEIREQQATDIVALNNDSLLAMADQAERRIDAINRIMSAALKMTNDRDWVIVGGAPYLQESGATKVARLFGISWRVDMPIYDQQPDGHFTYTYKGEMSMGGITIEAVGMRSSKDEFFTGSGAKSPKKRPEDIDRGDVMKAAYTNCINNGIKRILPGLRNLSVDDLKQGGRNPDNMKGYSFRGDDQRSDDAKANVEKIKKLLKDIFGDDAKAAADALEAATTFKGRDGNQVPGKRDVDKLTDKQMEVLIPKMEKRLADERAAQVAGK